MISAETQFRDLTDLDHGSRQPFFPALKSAKFARDFNQRSNLCPTKTHPQGDWRAVLEGPRESFFLRVQYAARPHPGQLLGRTNHGVGYSSSCRCQVRAFAKKEAFALRSLAARSSASDHFEKSR